MSFSIRLKIILSRGREQNERKKCPKCECARIILIECWLVCDNKSGSHKTSTTHQKQQQQQQHRSISILIKDASKNVSSSYFLYQIYGTFVATLWKTQKKQKPLFRSLCSLFIFKFLSLEYTHACTLYTNLYYMNFKSLKAWIGSATAYTQTAILFEMKSDFITLSCLRWGVNFFFVLKMQNTQNKQNRRSCTST